MRGSALLIALAVGCSSSGDRRECDGDNECRGLRNLCVEGRCEGPEYVGEGETCHSRRLCEAPGHCLEGRCVLPAGHGDACSNEPPLRRCAEGLTCLDDRCSTAAEIAARREREKRELERRRLELVRERERRMFEKSGVDKPARAPAEKVAAPKKVRHPGAAVRVVEVSEDGYAFAACRSNERLIGGECSGAAASSRPDNFTEADTVGARWVCKATATWREVTAIALCAALPRR